MEEKEEDLLPKEDKMAVSLRLKIDELLIIKRL